MHLGVVTTSYPRWPGDPAGSFVGEHVRWLARAGHTVDVICAGEGELARDSFGARVFRVPAAPELFYSGGAPEALGQSRRAWLSALAFAARMGPVIRARARSWDGVIAHWLVPCGALAAVLAPRVPMTAIAHSGDVHLCARAKLVAPVAALLAARRARVAFVSEELRHLFLAEVPVLLRDLLARRSVVRSMGVDAERFAALRNDRAVDADRSEPVVLFLGRLVPVKGVDILLDAAAQWRSNARLIIAGDGPCADELRARSAGNDRIELVGEVSTRERDRLLRRADLLVLPSVHVEAGRTEGMPMVVLEAMAARVPVVASRLGGMAELPPGAIETVPPADPDALAAAVDRLLGHPGVIQSQVQIAFRYARNQNWSVVGPILLPG
jgi:glycosyltransferase involved in cell wall biosynthesis